ncbi:sigma-70 family RNA polymerase sigma factor [Rhodanobacter aciditrophus]|uniref:Sigma-70 family RNA polymerase sigma factor n=1 Tax=Rhodanobacter aciditrophus TaxID=1623218 RepID=A0ABW4B3A5_9GAMM
MSLPASNVAQSHFNSFYSEHQTWLYKWIHRRLECHFDASDLTQDTFLRLYERREIQSIDSPRAYLATIAKGLISHFYRRKSIEQSYLEHLALSPEVFQLDELQRQILIETLTELDASLDRLPAQVKQAFLMSQLEGLTYKVIAEHMQVSEITVKRYMKQAFMQCLLLMEDDLFE